MLTQLKAMHKTRGQLKSSDKDLSGIFTKNSSGTIGRASHEKWPALDEC